MAADPFDTATIRAATLAAWRASPTRLAEDLAAESDLITVGYRDRLITELAANAADAAAAAGIDGELALWCVEDGSGRRELHVANTGEPLSAAGVRSLAALRVSAKADEHGQVGRFGVGFTATAAVADRVEVRSRTGSVLFDAALGREAIREGIAADRDLPLLRLPWPSSTSPADGFDTEVVLRLREDVDADALLAGARAEAPDLVVELSALQKISVASWQVTVETEAVVADRGGEVSATEVRVEVIDGDDTGTRRWLQVQRGATRWLVRAEGPSPSEEHGRDVLRAPTPTGIELSLPCRCITDLALTSDRRHLHPDADIADAAAGYVDLLRLVDASRRLSLVPEEHRARNRDDARLIEAVRARLGDARWLPGADGNDLLPGRATVLVGLTDELAAALGDIFGDLVHPDISAPRDLPVLARLGVAELGLAGLADRLVGVEREPAWWHRLYAALSLLVPTSHEAQELAAIPVPRSDGRMAIGVRGLCVSGSLTRPLSWLPTVDPVAHHPLLERLGVQQLSVAEALADPGLRALVCSADPDEQSPDELLDEVVALLAADPDVPVPGWMSSLAVEADDGEWYAADELLLPDSPIRSVLVEDHPFGVVAERVVERVGASALRRIGVGWGFMLVRDELPTGPDHDLPDEEQWWDWLTGQSESRQPEILCAVRDLDLVDEADWPAALTLLMQDEQIAPLLTDRFGYTAWWLRHHAVVADRLLGSYRAPSDTAHLGVLDALDHEHADALTGVLAGPDPETLDEATLLIGNLTDPDRRIQAGVAVSVHASLLRAFRAGVFAIDDLPAGGRARTVSGHVTEDVVVVDRPWLLQVLDADAMVLSGTVIDVDDADLLADILDVRVASEALEAWVVDAGEADTGEGAEAVLFAAEAGRDPVAGEVRLHDDLRVRLRRDDGPDVEVSVRWWVDDRGVTHLLSG